MVRLISRCLRSTARGESEAVRRSVHGEVKPMPSVFQRQVSSSRKRVLIVEDELDALEMLEAWLVTKGWDVRTARTGRAALEVSATFQPELLITDYFLQDDVTGVDLITQLRARGRKMRCVLLTGILQNALLEGARRLHRIPILTKPIDFGRLDELVSRGPAS